MKTLTITLIVAILTATGCAHSATQTLADANARITQARLNITHIKTEADQLDQSLLDAQTQLKDGAGIARQNEETIIREQDNFLGPASHNLIRLAVIGGLLVLVLIFIFSPANLVTIATACTRWLFSTKRK